MKWEPTDLPLQRQERGEIGISPICHTARARELVCLENKALDLG